MLKSLRSSLSLAALGLVFVCSTGFSGCEEKSFPQFSAVFERVGEPEVSLHYGSYSPHEVLGDYQLPQRLEVVHGMQFNSGGYRHYLRFDPLSGDDPLAGSKRDADAPFVIELSELTRKFTGSPLYPKLDGKTVYEEKGSHPGDDPGCWIDYGWSIFVNSTSMQPVPDLLKRLYDTHRSVEVSGGGVREVEITESQTAEPPINAEASAEWHESLRANLGLRFVLELRLGALGNAGCTPVNGLAPTIDRPLGTIKATYFAKLLDYNDGFNPVFSDLKDLKRGADEGKVFFSQIVQKPWLPGVSK